MLKSVRIENFAFFDQATLSPSAGFNALTGESGAGKTLVIKALRLITGDKATPDLIAEGHDEAYIEAVFDTIPDSLRDLVDEGDDLVLARRLRRSGPSRAFVCGRTVSSSLLAEAGEQLMTMVGQHSSQRLTSSTWQRQILDQQHNFDLSLVATSYLAWKEAEKEASALRQRLLETDRNVEIMKADVEIFRGLEPEDDEEEKLADEVRLLANSDETAQALSDLSESITADGGALDQIKISSILLDTVPDLAADVETAVDRLRELSWSARQQSEQVGGGEHRLQEASDRLSAIGDLRRRFRGLEMAEIRERVEGYERDIAAHQGGDQALEELAAESARQQKIFAETSTELTAARQSAAGILAANISSNFARLSLSAQIQVNVAATTPSSFGCDRISFLFDTGLGFAELSKGASGGELSRINLAILLATADSGVYIFDEVDTGISGQAAHHVGQCLRELAEKAQVVSITHLAPVATRADCHLMIRRNEQGRAEVVALEEGQRQEEIARLIGASSDDKEAASGLISRAAS